MSKLLITESERDSILSLYKNIDITTKVNLSEETVTNYDKQYDYKKESDKYYFKLKGDSNWKLASGAAASAIANKVFKSNTTDNTRNVKDTTDNTRNVKDTTNNSDGIFNFDDIFNQKNNGGDDKVQKDIFKDVFTDYSVNTTYDKNYDYKREDGKYYYKRKGSEKWLLSTGDLTSRIATKVFNDSGGTKSEGCIALSKEECAKISSDSQTEVSSGSETRCSAYMVKCLSQYNSELFAGNAWDAFNNVKNNGSVKYNAYTDGSVKWNYIYSQLKENKIGRDICTKYAGEDDADKVFKSQLPTIVTNSVPSTSKVNLKSLELGDIVGLYHSSSANKGMAFCQRALKRNLDNSGNIDKDPFTFNSHVGFVGAIKNGVPIIIHNVHGHHMATPANKMLSKTSDDMIVWVVSDNDVKNAIK